MPANDILQSGKIEYVIHRLEICVCTPPKIQHMKTTIKPDISVPENQVLSGKLKQLTHEFPLSHIFYHPAIAKEVAHVVIIAEESGMLKSSNHENGFSTTKTRKQSISYYLSIENES